MKISANRVREFLGDPGPEVRAILVYGPDAGLVNERADAAAKSVVVDLKDPFLVSELAEGDLRADQARLADEAAALTLTGGRRVIRVRDATDALATHIEDFLARGIGDALIVLRASDLGPKSKLRQLFEKSSNAAAVACYADDMRALDRMIHDTFSARDISVTPEAVAFLITSLGADRAVSRTELEKLAIYAGDNAEITLDDAIACIGDSSAFTLDGLAFAVGDGDQAAVDRAYARCQDEGTAAVAVIRVVQRHLTRLQLVLAETAKSGDALRAMQALRPPVFFKFKDRFQRQLRCWRADNVAQALTVLLDAEHAVKQTRAPVEAVCGHALTRVAGLTMSRTSN